MKKFTILIPIFNDWESLEKLLNKINDNINSTIASERDDIENKLMDNIDGFSNVITTITDNINASKSTTTTTNP